MALKNKHDSVIPLFTRAKIMPSKQPLRDKEMLYDQLQVDNF